MGVGTFHTFPGEKICTGTLSEGKPGNSGSGEQLVAILRMDVWCRTSFYSLVNGRTSHYYKWDGWNLYAHKPEERRAHTAYIKAVEFSEHEGITAIMEEENSSSPYTRIIDFTLLMRLVNSSIDSYKDPKAAADGLSLLGEIPDKTENLSSSRRVIRFALLARLIDASIDAGTDEDAVFKGLRLLRS